MGEEWSNLKVLFMPHSFKDLTSLAFLYSARVLLTRLQRQRISRAEDRGQRVNLRSRKGEQSCTRALGR